MTARLLTLFVLLLPAPLVGAGNSIFAEYATKFAFPSDELHRRTGYCSAFLDDLRRLVEPHTAFAVARNAALRSSLRLLSPNRSASFARQARRARTPEELRLVLADSLPEQRLTVEALGLHLTAELLADPRRADRPVVVGEGSPMRGLVFEGLRVQDHPSLQPLSQHQIVQPLMDAEVAQADGFSRELAFDSGLTGPELLYVLRQSYADLRFGQGALSRRYTQPEIVRASVVLARTWQRRAADLTAALLHMPWQEGELARALDLVNLVETVYPLSTLALLPLSVAQTRGNSHSLRVVAVTHLTKVHRSYLELRRLAAGVSEVRTMTLREGAALGPYPLIPYLTELTEARGVGTPLRDDLTDVTVLTALARFTAAVHSIPARDFAISLFPEFAILDPMALSTDALRTWLMDSLYYDLVLFRGAGISYDRLVGEIPH